MSKDELELQVKEQLNWAPSVDGSAIAVSVDDHGVITLRGTMGSFHEKREARNAAKRVYGVKSVRDELKVRLLAGKAREDADLRGAVLQALMHDSLVPSTIDARVELGWVTLTGAAQWHFQREEAEFVAGNVSGVVDVVNKIDLESPGPKPADVKTSIEKALERNAEINADWLTVITYNGTVAVTGIVGSWSEHDDAIAAAWAAPGVTRVDDRIVVDY